jgi:hypothetical protein
VRSPRAWRSLVVGIEAFAGLPPLAPPLLLGVASAAALAVLVATGVVTLRATMVTRVRAR